jgi:hypothetical protein
MLTSSKNIDENSNCTSKKSKSSGGFTCCVPGCFNNNKRSPELSFYNFPNGKSKESVERRKKWIRLISRVNFTPTISHRVCSEHFSGGKKTYTNNLPTIVPSSQVTKPAKPYNPRPTVKARNRTFVSKKNNANGTTPQSRRRLFSKIKEDANSNLENIDPNDPETMPAAGKQTVEESSVLEEKIALLTKENKRLQAKNEQSNIQVIQLKEEIKHEQNKMSFSVENFKHNDKLIRFYSGLQDYATFKALFDSLGKAVNHLTHVPHHNYRVNTEPKHIPVIFTTSVDTKIIQKHRSRNLNNLIEIPLETPARTANIRSKFAYFLPFYFQM